MIEAVYFIQEIIPRKTMIKVIKGLITIYEGTAGEIDYRLVSPYDIMMIRPISLVQRTDEHTETIYPNALEITVG